MSNKINGKIFSLSFVYCFLVFLCFVEAKDPFDSPLFQQEESNQEIVSDYQVPDLVVQGILFNVDMPQTIIDGEVYKEGDSLKSGDGKIVRVEKSKVIILYQGRVYKLEINKKED